MVMRQETVGLLEPLMSELASLLAGSVLPGVRESFVRENEFHTFILRPPVAPEQGCQFDNFVPNF